MLERVKDRGASARRQVRVEAPEIQAAQAPHQPWPLRAPRGQARGWRRTVEESRREGAGSSVAAAASTLCAEHVVLWPFWEPG